VTTTGERSEQDSQFSAEPTTRVVTVGGQPLRIGIRPGSGATATPPLLLLNGIGAGLEVLDPLVAALDPAVEVIRVDVPGSGGSPAGAFPLGYPQLAWLLARLLDDLGHATADVLGYSWGGGLAQQFALQCPARVRRLVLVSSSTGALSVPGSPVGYWAMLTPRRYRSPRDVAAMAGLVDDVTATVGSSPELPGIPDPAAVLGYLHQLGAVATWTSLPFLRLLRQRTLVVTGTDDRVVPSVNSRILAALIPNAMLVEVPGGHAAIVQHAGALAPRIVGFLTS
jgi:poly(3-hydroxyalkanoate) depolymerase